MPEGLRGREALERARAASRSKSGGGVEGAGSRRRAGARPTASPGEQEARLRVVEGEVVLGVPGRVDRGEDVAGTDLDLVAVLQDPDALRRGRVEPSVEAVEERAVDLLGRRPPAGPGRPGGGRRARGRRPSPSGNARATSPTPPAWSRWMWVTATPARSSGATPRSSRAASRAGTELWLPVSTSTGAGPSIRYPAVTRSQPPSRVSIWSTPSPMRVAIGRVLQRGAGARRDGAPAPRPSPAGTCAPTVPRARRPAPVGTAAGRAAVPPVASGRR
jgi:hypothetical protein